MSSAQISSSLQPLRVLHLVSRDAQAGLMERSTLRAALTAIPRTVVEPHVVRFSNEDAESTTLRLLGVPVHDIALSRRQFSPMALRKLNAIAHACSPHIVHAWNHTAQLAAVMLESHLPAPARMVWTMTSTRPQAGLIAQARMHAVLKWAHRADAIVYGSVASATAHHDAGFPNERHRIVAPGVNAELYKPDFSRRRQVREQIGIASDAFVIGMHAPFGRFVDHALLLQAAAKLSAEYPRLQLLLGGAQVELQNAALTSLLRQVPTLSKRVHAVGKSLDMAELFNASDIACFTATVDSRRLDIAAAMLCGLPCVATSVGAQRELLGDFGMGVAPESVHGLVEALRKVATLSSAERALMAQRAREHALRNYTVKRTAGRYQRLYEKLQNSGE
ncbi:MAG: glycosyltransferase [Steroidobacteraceae bacterium]